MELHLRSIGLFKINLLLLILNIKRQIARNYQPLQANQITYIIFENYLMAEAYKASADVSTEKYLKDRLQKQRQRFSNVSAIIQRLNNNKKIKQQRENKNEICAKIDFQKQVQQFKETLNYYKTASSDYQSCISKNNFKHHQFAETLVKLKQLRFRKEKAQIQLNRIKRDSESVKKEIQFFQTQIELVNSIDESSNGFMEDQVQFKQNKQLSSFKSDMIKLLQEFDQEIDFSTVNANDYLALCLQQLLYARAVKRRMKRQYQQTLRKEKNKKVSNEQIRKCKQQLQDIENEVRQLEKTNQILKICNNQKITKKEQQVQKRINQKITYVRQKHNAEIQMYRNTILGYIEVSKKNKDQQVVKEMGLILRQATQFK